MKRKTRTTVRLPPDLLREAKTRAAERGTTLTRLIEDALRESLARDLHRPAEAEAVRLPTVGGSGLQPGVDLDDTASLLELMESAGDPA